jgi:hypothetical protein
MKNIKKRFKRALANFLRDELLEIIGYDPYPKLPHIVHTHRDFGVIKSEFDFDIHTAPSFMSEPRQYEEMLDLAKKKMFKAIEPCIEVEAKNLVSPEFYNRRKIRLSLMVKNPSKVNSF